MNRLLTVLLTTLAWSATASACPHSAQMFLCPGDKVVDPNGNRGVAHAVNPFQHTVAINYGGASDANYQIPEVALGVGCLEGYCVLDAAVDPNGNRGRIDGVNPYNGTVALNYGGASDAIYNIREVAIGFGCKLGYCVGDKVVDPNGNEGVIDAINRANGNAAVNYGGASDALYAIPELSSSEYCATYGDAQRQLPMYPVFRTDQYIAPNLHYTLSRPVR